MADQQQQVSPSKKSVSFSQDVLVALDLRFSMRARRKMFLTKEELQSFQENVYDEACWARSLGAKALQQNDSLRGLEMLIDEEDVMERRKHKFLGQLAVFTEQDRQFLERGSSSPLDFDAMARRYGAITELSKALARKRAIFYQQMEKVSDNEDELVVADNGRIPMPTDRPRFSVGPSAA